MEQKIRHKQSRKQGKRYNQTRVREQNRNLIKKPNTRRRGKKSSSKYRRLISNVEKKVKNGEQIRQKTK